MKSIDIKGFRKTNNLTQSDLADYLGCSKAFISSVENGNRPLPLDMLSKLVDNPHGWDVSMLQPSEVGEVLQMQEDGLVAELRAQIERLESKVDNLNQEIGEKNALIRLLREGVAKSV